MTDTLSSSGIGKACKDCGKFPHETVFSTRAYTNKNSVVLSQKSICNTCEAKRAKKRRQENSDRIADIKQRYRDKHYGTIRHHVQEKISTWKKASCTHSDLTVDYLVSLYERQDGYCYYSGEKMVFGWVDGKVHHNSLSLDKLDPAKGYVQGNVVWCSYLVNTMKQNMTDKQFYNTIDKIYSTTYGISMINELSIADKLRKITTQAKLGELPKVLERECADDAKLGKDSKRIYFIESGRLQFFGALGPANQVIYKDIQKPFDRKFSITEEDWVRQIVKDLEQETSLSITIVDPPHWKTDKNEVPDPLISRMYYPGAGLAVTLILDVSWHKKT